MNQKILELRKKLEELESKKNVDGMRKFAIEADGAYGVKLPILRKLTAQIKGADLNLLNELWKGSIEEKLIAIFLFEKLSKKLDSKTQVKAVESWLPKIKDWSACDQLAINWKYWIRSNEKEFWQLANKWIKNSNFWIRRFALACAVVLSHKGNKNKINIANVLSLCDKVMLDKEKYVQKAIHWLLREATWRDEQAVFRFIKKWQGKAQQSTLWQGSAKLPSNLRAKLK